MAVFVAVGFACDRDGGWIKCGDGVKQCAVVFAAIHAVTNANAFGFARCCDLDRAAGAAACMFGHGSCPLGQRIGSTVSGPSIA